MHYFGFYCRWKYCRIENTVAGGYCITASTYGPATLLEGKGAKNGEECLIYEWILSIGRMKEPIPH